MNQGAALIALGANMPHAGASLPDTILAAIAAVQAAGLKVVAQSRLYSTPCFPPGAGPDYVNAAIAVSTDWAPLQVLTALHAIEAEFGRTRQVRWGMRTLDLDLLALGDAVL
ncbi:MAG: 2-amino-4-hydroxy-6-hydroxymethyldihydropteridine diphosphokinase, partial [Lutimaribacter sp.]